MKIEIKRLDDAFHLEATNEEGRSVEIDGAEKIGGSNKGMRPMQMLLSSLGGCSAIDVILILKKQRQPVDDIRITITAERQVDQTPSLFEKVHVHFQLYGELSESKVQRAVSLSMDKYCSVARILEKTAKISWSYEIIEGLPRRDAFPKESYGSAKD
jgi:putative redox protein